MSLLTFLVCKKNLERNYISQLLNIRRLRMSITIQLKRTFRNEVSSLAKGHLTNTKSKDINKCEFVLLFFFQIISQSFTGSSSCHRQCSVYTQKILCRWRKYCKLLKVNALCNTFNNAMEPAKYHYYYYIWSMFWILNLWSLITLKVAINIWFIFLIVCWMLKNIIG